jgi:hypothetical protein
MGRLQDDPLYTAEGEAFEAELAAAPWAYGQIKPLNLHEVLARMRGRGLDDEADWVLAEMTRLALS